MDQLEIKGLTAMTRIGVHSWEQQIDQRLSIDILIPGDFSNCNDSLAQTIDYDLLCQRVTDYIESNSFQLIETVADSVAALVKDTFQVECLTVSVSKPHAIKNASDIRVTVLR